MIKDKNIVKIGSDILRKKSDKVLLPISKDDLKSLNSMIQYLKNSQDPDKAEKYKLRAGVGLAAPQIGINKRMFAVLVEDFCVGVINPEITAESVKMIYLSGGEGCLSIPEESGTVLRHKVIEIHAHFYYPDKNEIVEQTLRLKDYIAIVFQHEYDHLDGILFTDKITNNLGDAEVI